MQSLWEYLQKFGPYHVFFLVLAFLPGLMTGMQALLFNFAGAVPKHRCCVPEFENCTDLEIPDYHHFQFDNHTDRWFHKSESAIGYCQYCPEGANFSNLNFTCHNGRPCDHGVIPDRSIFHTTAAVQFDMLCGSAWKIDTVKSLYMVGVLIGSAVSGVLSDKFGRRPLMVFGSLIGLVVYNLTPFSTNYAMLCIFQALTGAIQVSIFIAVFVVLMELVSGWARTICGIMFQGYFSVGYVYVGVAAIFIRDWRWLIWTVSLPALLYLPYYFLFPESIRWLVLHDRAKEARKLVDKISSVNKLSIPEGVINDGLAPPEVTPTATIVELFKNRTLAKNTIIVFFTWFVSSMVYYGLAMNVGDLPGDIFTNFITSGMAEVPGLIITVPLMECWGRKPCLIIFFVVGGICCIVSGLLPKDLGTLIIWLAIIGKMCIAGAFSCIYNYTSELFPTVIRHSVTGFSSMCARLGSIAAPQIHQLGHLVAPWLPIVIYGGFSLAAATADLFLPETKNRPMLETMEDGINETNKVHLQDLKNAENKEVWKTAVSEKL